MKVKQFIRIFLSSLTLIIGLTPSVALAVESTTATTTSAQAQTTSLSEADKQKLLERLALRKAEIKLKLTTAQKTRLQTKCKAAQGLIAPIISKVQGYEQGRGEVYGKIVTRLTELSTKLKNRGASTTELDAAVTTLQAKVTTFNTDFATYKQVVSDLKDMECATDPEAFQASLQTARTALTKVNTDATDIRAYVKDTIKPILQKIRAELEPKQEETQ
jgi:hypothetical protein